MKKAFIFLIAGLVLTGLVFAAGCTSTPADPVAGQWKWAEGNGNPAVVYTFNADGTGNFYSENEYSYVNDEGSEVSGSSSTSETFHWTKNENVYTVTWMNDPDSVFTYDAAANTLTNKETGAVLIRK
ncbi:MAG TPA: hypothetical protein O0X39_06115 [Methanocorpusculum sp.]|nr:hypothetical protein [Methanocorpusculum sp.]